MSEYNNIPPEEGRELDWDSTIQNDSAGFVLLAPGDYNFEVKSFERGRHNGSDKLPPCNKAIVTFEVGDGDKSTTIKNNFFLHTRTEGLICEFFTAVGLRKRGEPLRMDWNAIIGRRGTCKVTLRKYTTDRGEEREMNQISRFYEPDESAPPAPSAGGGWKPGSF